MPGTFQLDVVTPDRVVLSEPVISLVAPGREGYLGVLPGHAPLVTELGVGALTYRSATGEEGIVAVAGGFMEVGRDRTTVLADAAERASDIDTDRAARARERARERLRAAAENREEVDSARAQASFLRASNRLRISGHGS